MEDRDLNLSCRKAEELCFSGEKLAVFGTGSVAEMIYHAVSNLELPFCFFIVNDGHKKEESFLGQKVYELSEVWEQADDYYVIYAINSRSEEISRPVRGQFGDRLLFEDYRVVLSVLLERFFAAYLDSKEIDRSGPWLDLGACRIINPFLKDFNWKLEWLTAMCDVILPPALSDYSYVNEGPYELDEVCLKEGEVVLDCGANVGAFSAVAASKGCKVYAFEPIPKVVSQLEELAGLYGGQIEIAAYALGDKAGRGAFYIDEDFSAVCTMREELRRSDEENRVYVDMTTVDEFIAQKLLSHIGFIKADIEGAERLMLEGAKETLLHIQPKLAIATYHLEGDREALEAIIKRINPKYHVTHRWKMLYAFVPEER